MPAPKKKRIDRLVEGREDAEELRSRLEDLDGPNLYPDRDLPKDEYSVTREKRSKRPEIPIAQWTGQTVPDFSAGASVDRSHPDFAHEEAHLDATIATMVRRILKLEEDESTYDFGADEDTRFIVGIDNAAEAEELSGHLKQPYFGRMDVRVRGKTMSLYVGKYPFADPGGAHSITDWRAPIAQYFYKDDTRFDKGEFLLKRGFDIDNRQLTAIKDLFDGDPERARRLREVALVDKLTEQSDKRMKDIIQTIQPEQDPLIRAPLDRPLVVQGPAGSGKTSVLFHRIAYLAYDGKGGASIDPRRVLVIAPNRMLATYVAGVLPDLKIEGVTITTFDEWALDQLGLRDHVATDRTLALLLDDKSKKDDKRKAWLRAKAMGDPRLVDAIRAHLTDRSVKALRAHTFQCDIHVGAAVHPFELRPSRLIALLKDVAAQGASVDGLRRTFANRVVGEAMAFLEARGLSKDDVNLTTFDQVRHDLQPLLDRALNFRSAHLEYKALFEQKHLLRGALRPFMEKERIDLLCAPDVTAVPRYLPHDGRPHLDVTELPIVLAFQNALFGTGQRLAHRNDTFDLLCVDEGQDLSPLHYRLLAASVAPGRINIYGDILQGIHGYRGLTSWQDALTQVRVSDDDAVYQLQRTYRSTQQIVAFSNAIASTYARSRTLLGEAVDRSGVPVTFHCCATDAEGADQVKADVLAAQAAGHRNVGIITRTKAEALRLHTLLGDRDLDASGADATLERYTGGVAVVPLILAKGLEFDACIIWNADTENFDPGTEYENRLLFVAATRGLHRVSLVSYQTPHPLLHGAASPPA